MSNFTAKRLVEIASAEVGYLEKKSNSQLDSKTANVGSKNFTKYGAWYGMNGQAWCAMFVSWCFYKLTNDKQLAKDLICGSFYASCTQMYNTFKKANRVFSKPKIGDIIVFNQSKGSSTMAHTGIVYDVSSTKVFTIEGNTSSASGVIANGGGVAKKSYSLSHNRIGGYLRPYYEQDSQQSSTTSNITVVINPYQLQLNSTGNSVNCLQKCLKGWGYDCGIIDGDFGQKTDAALKKFQTDNKLEIDGIAGQQTWKTLTGAL